MYKVVPLLILALLLVVIIAIGMQGVASGTQSSSLTYYAMKTSFVSDPAATEVSLETLKKLASPNLENFSVSPNPIHVDRHNLIEQEEEIDQAYDDFPSLPVSNEIIRGPSNATGTEVLNVGQMISNSDIKVFGNEKITPSSYPSVIDEPSLARNDNIIFYTGNWYAARSTDGGASWKYLNPYYRMNFCCDQDVIYDHNHEKFIWYRQGNITIENASESSFFRLGISSDAKNWWSYDVKPTDINSTWRNQFFDLPHLALGNKYLYISTNLFYLTSHKFIRAVILRISLDDLSNARPALYSYYQDSSRDADIFTPVQGATNTMFWAVHILNNKIRIYQWDESTPSTDIKKFDRHIPAWTRLTKAQGKCITPDSTNWCGRANDKISSGWISGDTIGFLWNAGAGSSSMHSKNFQWPYIEAATFKISNNFTYIGRPNIWSPNFAWLYGYAAPDGHGNVGILAFYGGGNVYPSTAIGIGNNADGSVSSWNLKSILSGTAGPLNNVWGDYIRVRSDDGLASRWIASGFTLQGGKTGDYIEPRYIVFGASRNNSNSPLLGNASYHNLTVVNINGNALLSATDNLKKASNALNSTTKYLNETLYKSTMTSHGGTVSDITSPSDATTIINSIFKSELPVSFIIIIAVVMASPLILGMIMDYRDRNAQLADKRRNPVSSRLGLHRTLMTFGIILLVGTIIFYLLALTSIYISTSPTSPVVVSLIDVLKNLGTILGTALATIIAFYFGIRGSETIAEKIASISTKSDNANELPPMVSNTSPFNGANSVPLDSLVTASFNNKMSSDINRNTFTVKRIIQKDTAEVIDVPGSVALGPDGRTAIFKSDKSFSPGTKYIAKIGGVKDMEGKLLNLDVSWFFTTIGKPEDSAS